MAWDLFFKRVLFETFKDFDAHTDVSVVKRERKIDLVVKFDSIPRSLKNEGLEPLVPLLNPITLFEFKSAHDHFFDYDLSKVMGYLGFYCTKHEIGYKKALEDVSYVIVTANKPKFFNTYEKEGIIFPLGKIGKTDSTDKEIQPSQPSQPSQINNESQFVPGLYRAKMAFNCFLLVIEELPVEKENLMLELMGNKKTLRKMFVEVAKNEERYRDKQGYLYDSYLLNYEDVKDLEEVEQLKWIRAARNIKGAVEHIGVKRVVDAVGVDEVISEIGIDKVVSEIGIDKVISEIGIDKVISEIGIDKVISEIGIDKVISEIGIDNLLRHTDLKVLKQKIQEIEAEKSKKND